MTTIVEPNNLGITLEEAKAFLVVDFTDDDSLITSIIETATTICEDKINQQLTNATYLKYFDKFKSEMKLYTPVTSINSLKYLDADNVVQTIDAINYYLDEVSMPSKLVFVEDFVYPTTTKRNNPIMIEFEVGMANIPQKIKSWIKQKVATLYEFREDFMDYKVKERDNTFIDSLISSYKVF